MRKAWNSGLTSKIYITCPVCKIVFFDYKNRKKCCSISCGRVGNKSFSGKKLTKKHKENISKACKINCVGKKGTIPWNKGKKCPQNSGPNHPNWKGGITLITRGIYFSKEYRQWRREVFKRDKYTCVICSKIGGELHSDHIRPRKLFPELIFEVSNGRTLCVGCHRKTPTYGNNKLKREGVEKYIAINQLIK